MEQSVASCQGAIPRPNHMVVSNMCEHVWHENLLLCAAGVKKSMWTKSLNISQTSYVKGPMQAESVRRCANNSHIVDNWQFAVWGGNSVLLWSPHDPSHVTSLGSRWRLYSSILASVTLNSCLPLLGSAVSCCTTPLSFVVMVRLWKYHCNHPSQFYLFDRLVSDQFRRLQTGSINPLQCQIICAEQLVSNWLETTSLSLHYCYWRTV